MTKKEQWQEFSKLVEDHIDNYVVPQYGDFPDKMIERWDVFSIESQLIRYVARIGTNVRGINEQKRDALKIAHYACYLLEKLK
jgi:hypothetical protein